jgi:hypothetical protein
MPRVDGTNRGVLITEESARRIGRAVQKLEQGNRNVPGRKMRTAFDDGGEDLLVGFTTEEWRKGTEINIAIIYNEAGNCEQEGEPRETAVSAINILFDVAAGSRVIVGRVANGCWRMLAASNDRDDGSGSSGDEEDECGVMSLAGQDLTTLKRYDPNKTQVLGHREGCLQWIDTTECTDTSS